MRTGRRPGTRVGLRSRLSTARDPAKPGRVAGSLREVAVLVREVVTYVEMTAPEQLRLARPARGVTLERVDRTSPLIRSTQDRVAAPHHWQSQSWSDEQWREWLSRPGLRNWIVRRHGEAAGVAELEAQPGGEVEITSFGLVPEVVGRGAGGHALTLAIRLAWGLEPVGAAAVRRVWLHTSSLDHPHALPNYRSRGFRPFRTEARLRTLPD